MKIPTLTRLMAALALLTAAPLTAQAAFNQILYTANYTGTPVLGTDTLGGVTYATVGYGDLYNDGQPGMPYLPVDYLRFSVPYNATNFRVTATCPVMYKTTRNLSHLVYPSQPPRLMNDTTPVVITLPDSTAYSAGGSYPMQQAWVVDEGFLDGENHIVTVAVMPFVYKRTSTSDKLEQWKRVNVRLQYDLSDSLAMYPIVRNDSTMREEGYNLARSMVVNPGQVKTFAPVDISNDFDSLGINLYGATGDGLNGGGYGGSTPVLPPLDSLEVDTTGLHTGVMYMNDIKYLIVTTADLFHSMRRLAALKRQKGYTVAVVTMDQVMHDPDACLGDKIKQADGTDSIFYNDSAGVLRQFLRKCYTRSKTEFVLLAGSKIPYRILNDNTNMPKGHGDMYYCDLNANWIDSIDRGPELYVGRLLGNHPDQFENYTDKLFQYELNPGSGDYSYLKNMIFTEGRDFIQQLNLFKYKLSTFFPNQIVITERAKEHYPKGRDIIDTIIISKPAFMVSFNHGCSSSIKVYGTDADGSKYTLWSIDTIRPLPNVNDNEVGNGLNQMKNRYYPMVYYALSCETMPYYKKHSYDADISYGESFTMGKNYGGPVYMGNTGVVGREELSKLAKQLAAQLINGNYIMGSANALSKYNYDDNKKNEISVNHNYLGDPALEIWTDVPHEFSNISISRTNNSVAVSGIDCDSATVVYLHNGIVIKKVATSSSITFNGVSPNGQLIVYKHNYLPFIAPIQLQNVNLALSQYVIATDVTAGKRIDTNRSTGNVTVKTGTNYEIEASGTVTLNDGFIVERGSTFAVYPSTF